MRISDWSSDVCSSDLEAQLYGVNTALVQARAALGEKRAKLEIIRTIRSTGGDLDTMADVIESPLIPVLRREEAELAAKNAQLATTLDTRHPPDRTSVGHGQNVSVRVDLGGRRTMKK